MKYMINYKRPFSALSIEEYITWNFSNTLFWSPVAESNEEELNWQTSLTSCTSQSNYVLIHFTDEIWLWWKSEHWSWKLTFLFLLLLLFLFIKLAHIQRHPSVALGTLRDIAMEVKKGVTNIKQDSTTAIQ